MAKQVTFENMTTEEYVWYTTITAPCRRKLRLTQEQAFAGLQERRELAERNAQISANATEEEKAKKALINAIYDAGRLD